MTTTHTPRPSHADAVRIVFARAVDGQEALLEAMSNPPASRAMRLALLTEANDALSLYASFMEIHITVAHRQVMDALDD